ncbi:MAG TPA: hypothetical protein VMT27_02630 [Actinomycetes bacterium]|nr:hypothetical protein [Actinomycetes bacterium]
MASGAVSPSTATSCAVTFTATGAQPLGAQCLTYDLASHQFLYTWKLSK